MPNPYKVLLADEIQAVLADLKTRTSKNGWLNLILFRLSCCCGLRVMELCGLNCGDLTVDGARPVIHIRRDNTKGWSGDPSKKDQRRERWVPLSWDRGTLQDLTAWFRKRTVEDGAGPNDPFLCCQSKAGYGRRMIRRVAQARWKTAIRCLGASRVRQLSIHAGRHSAASHSSLGGHAEASVQDMLGHGDPRMTRYYVHVLQEAELPDVFAPREVGPMTKWRIFGKSGLLKG